MVTKPEVDSLQLTMDNMMKSAELLVKHSKAMEAAYRTMEQDRDHWRKEAMLAQDQIRWMQKHGKE